MENKAYDVTDAIEAKEKELVKVADTATIVKTKEGEADGYTVDGGLELSGGYGRFQAFTQFATTLCALCIGYQSIASYFIADDPSWRCRSRNSSAFCTDYYGKVIGKNDAMFSSRCRLNRSEWTYTTKTLYTYTTEFDLVCDKTALAAFASGVYHIGGLIGVPVSGLFADKYGRKYILLLCLILNTTFSIGCCYVSSVVHLIGMRLILGATGWSAYNIAFVYMGEFVTPKHRTVSANIIGTGYSVSILLVTLVAYYCRAWKSLQLYVTLPSFFVILVLIPLPESPRWFLTNNKRKDRAEQVLNLIARINNKSDDTVDICLKTPNTSTTNTGTYLDLIRNIRVFGMTLSLGFIWLTAGMSFYMISFETSNLGGNMYTSFAFTTLATLPSNFVSIYPLNRFGRKKFVLLCLTGTGLLSGSTIIIPGTFVHAYTLRMAILSLASFSSFCTIIGCFIWTFEIFPTSLRLQGWGICIALERVGSFTAPFLTTVLHQYNPKLPYIVAMVLTILASLGGINLAETNNAGTRESYDDIFVTSPPQSPVNDSTFNEKRSYTEENV